MTASRQHSTSSNLILGLIFRVKALRTHLSHFSYESSKNASFSNTAQLLQGWVRTSAAKANVLPRLPGARTSNERAAAGGAALRQGKASGAVGKEARHGIRQGGFLLEMSHGGFLRCFFYAASEAYARSRQALLHPGTPLSP